MRVLVALLLASACLVASCRRSSAPPETTDTSNTDAALRQALSAYVVEFLRRNPTTMFSEVVDFLPGSCGSGAQTTEDKRASCESAERAIFRYSKWPTQAQ